MNETIKILNEHLVWEQDQLARLNSDLIDCKERLDKTQSKLNEKQLLVENITKQLETITALQA